MLFFDVLKSILYGIVEGITEWLPISSTGHLIIAQRFLPFSNEVSANFPEMFNYVIQFGAILAVIVLYFKTLWPFKMPDKNAKLFSVDTGIFKGKQWNLWFKVLLATLPSILALLPDAIIEKITYSENGSPTNLGIIIISVALILYGILFIIIENKNKGKSFKVNSVDDISFKLAFFIGCFQILAIIPGTSRSGATILGALLIGVARPAAAEFSFFMAIPTMAGVSLLKIAQFLSESTLHTNELIILLVGLIISFIISMVCIKALTRYVRKHNFALFGYYRIILGILLILLLSFKIV